MSESPELPQEHYNPITPAIAEVYSEALTIASNKHGNGFEVIKNTFIDALARAEGYSVEQKTGIMLVAEKLSRRQGGPLLGILDFKWSEVPGYADDTVTPLLPSEREAILQGVLGVCRGIIAQEAARLQAAAQKETPLDTDWYERLNPAEA